MWGGLPSSAQHGAKHSSSPSPAAADSALSSSNDLEGRAADPAALAPSKDTAVETWLRAALCRGRSDQRARRAPRQGHHAHTYRAGRSLVAVGVRIRPMSLGGLGLCRGVLRPRERCIRCRCGGENLYRTIPSLGHCRRPLQRAKHALWVLLHLKSTWCAAQLHRATNTQTCNNNQAAFALGTLAGQAGSVVLVLQCLLGCCVPQHCKLQEPVVCALVDPGVLICCCRHGRPSCSLAVIAKSVPLFDTRLVWPRYSCAPATPVSLPIQRPCLQLTAPALQHAARHKVQLDGVHRPQAVPCGPPRLAGHQLHPRGYIQQSGGGTLQERSSATGGHTQYSRWWGLAGCCTARLPSWCLTRG